LAKKTFQAAPQGMQNLALESAGNAAKKAISDETTVKTCHLKGPAVKALTDGGMSLESANLVATHASQKVGIEIRTSIRSKAMNAALSTRVRVWGPPPPPTSTKEPSATPAAISSSVSGARQPSFILTASIANNKDDDDNNNEDKTSVSSSAAAVAGLPTVIDLVSEE